MMKNQPGACAVDILRRLQRGEPIGNEEWEAITKATDDELAAVCRDPTQWSYMVRDPTGTLVATGKAKTRRECERWAIRYAEEHVYEHHWTIIDTGAPPFDFVWNWKLLGKWRFILWPPEGTAERMNRLGERPANRALCLH
jgi:hypothetical protein